MAGGLGVSIVSMRAARNFLREKRILAFELTDKTDSRDLYVTCRRDQMNRSTVKDFMEFITRYYANGPRS